MPAPPYADDVSLLVHNMVDLERFLITCKEWALKYGMKSALSKVKSEILLPSEFASQYIHHPFACGCIKSVTKARNLGVITSTDGTLECNIRNRIQMAHASLSILQNARLPLPGVDPGYARMVYLNLIQNKWTMLHFCVRLELIQYKCLTRF